MMRPAVCLLGVNGRQVELEEDSHDLEVVESFQDFLRIAPPPVLPHEVTPAQYAERIGLERMIWWWWICQNDPQLRSYIDGGPWL